MKNIFSRNRRTVEIILTLLLVFIAGSYYYLIYIPARENEIIQRRFRTLRRVEVNMQQKFGNYVSTLKSFIGRFNDAHINRTGIDTLLKQYGEANQGKFDITGERVDLFSTVNSKDSVVIPNPSDSSKIIDINCHGITVVPTSNGKNLKIIYDTVFNAEDKKHNSYKKHVRVEASINYPQFLIPLLPKGIFDHYIVFNGKGDTSNIIYEDFPSGISFNSIDSLFNTTKQIYTSKIVTIESGGEKYLAFLHPCGYVHKNDRIVAGLQKLETFDKQKRQLPESMVTTLLFIALFCFLLLPVIRLSLMGRSERIRFFDLFTAYFSFLLLVPVIILVFFWNYRNFLPKSKDGKDSKKVLANEISRSLKNELDSIYNLMETIDSLHDTTHYYNPALSILIKDTINIHYLAGDGSPHYFNPKTKETDSAFINAAVDHLDCLLKRDTTRDIYPESVFWLDSSTGAEVANWSFEEDPPRGNYQDRDYFKNARDNHVVSLEDNPERTFAFEPVVSRSDGQFKFVISKKSRCAGLVVACPSRLRSVINPVLPVGFNFSITDADGNTVFDSDTTDNLNENLAEEMDDSSAFKAVLNTRTSKKFTTRFEDEAVNVLAQPIGSLPYFIVISENTSFASAFNTQVFSFTIVMMFSFFLFLCVELIIVFICRHRQTKLLKNSFDLSWIHPRRSLSRKYFFGFLFNTLLLITLAFFCFTNFSMQKLTTYIFLFVVASLLSSIGACIYNAGETADQIGKKRIRRKRCATFVLCLIAIIALTDAWYVSVATGVTTLWFTLTSVAINLTVNWLTAAIHENNIKHYATNFHRMIFSKLVLTSGIPVIIFFFCSNNFEQKLEERLKLFTYAENIEQHVNNGGKLQHYINQIRDNTRAVKEFYIDSNWIYNVSAQNSIDSLSPAYSPADSICLSLLKTSRVNYNEVSTGTQNFEVMRPFSTEHDQFMFSNILHGPADTLQYRIMENSNNKSETKYINLSSAGAQMSETPSLFSFPSGFLFWVLLVSALTICYQLLTYTINKIFGIRIHGNEEFKNLNEMFIQDESIRYLFVQGIPGSGKTKFIITNLKAGGKYVFYDNSNPSNDYNAIIFNLEQIPSTGEMESRLVEKQPNFGDGETNTWNSKIATLYNRQIECIVFTHFEYKILDNDTNKIKLGLVEKFLAEGTKKIIITSDIDPVEYFNSLKNFDNDSPAQKRKKAEGKKAYIEQREEDESNSAFAGYINRWNNLLGRFTNIYTDNNSSYQTRHIDHSYSSDFMNNEFSCPSFLKNYQSQFEKYPCREETSEDNILKIQSLSDQSYREIWHSLTKEEQITLYDLAEDGLVNTNNDRTLTILINKGLIVNKDRVLVLVNHSFRNFILMIVNPATLKNIERKVSDGLTWNDYKYPALIILATLVYFVFYSSPEKFGNVLPLVSGIMAGVPTILKLLSYMKPAEK